MHNTYFTLPVLFVMTSNHFAMAYGHAYNWLILIGISLAGALIRIYFVARHKGKASALPASGSPSCFSQRSQLPLRRAHDATRAGASFDQVRNVINARCTSCHSDAPVHPAFPVAPLGIMLRYR